MLRLSGRGAQGAGVAKSASSSKRPAPQKNLNKERAQDRYEIDPRAFLRLQDSLRETGQEVVGFYHSHPDHPSRLSPTDLERMGDWEGWIYIIVGVDGKGGGSKRYRVSTWSLEEHNLAVL